MGRIPEKIGAHPEVVLTELADGTGVLLHMGTKFYYVLNEAGVYAWKALQAGRESTLEGLTRAMESEFDVDLETARRDLGDMLGVLVDEGLVVG